MGANLRRLLLGGRDTLSEKGGARLIKTLREDDPTRRSARPGATRSSCALAWPAGRWPTPRREDATGLLRAGLGHTQTWRLWETINAWWTEIEVFLITGLTNARTEAANTSIKQLKRTGREYRNAEHYKVRILQSAVPPDVRYHLELVIARKGSQSRARYPLLSILRDGRRKREPKAPPNQRKVPISKGHHAANPTTAITRATVSQ